MLPKIRPKLLLSLMRCNLATTKFLVKGKLPKQPVIEKVKFFSRRAEEKIKVCVYGRWGGGGGLCPGSLKSHGGKFIKCSHVLKKKKKNSESSVSEATWMKVKVMRKTQGIPLVMACTEKV